MSSPPSILTGPNMTLPINHINKLFENVVKSASSNTVALIFEEHDEVRRLSYLQVNQIANKFSRTIIDILRTKNVVPNSDGDYIVAVNMHPSDYLILVLLAIWKSGCAYLPLDHNFPSSRIDGIIQDAQPVMVIYDEDTKQFGRTTTLSYKTLVRLSSNQLERNLEDVEPFHHQKDDLAIVLYTSGSTGIPKGVRLAHRNILNRLQWQFKAFPYSNSERVCVFKTALAFFDSCAEIWGPLINGLSLLVLPKSATLNAEKLIDILDAYRVERLVLVPSLLKSILMCIDMKQNNYFLKSLHLCVCSGEILSLSLAHEFFNYFPENECHLCNFYGSTEITGDVTFYIISNRDQLKNCPTVPIGTPVDNTIIYLLDSDLQPVKQGDLGELFVSGSNLASGYVNGQHEEKFLKNHLSENRIFSTLYRTGDFARFQDGVLLYEGRTDSQVKVRGHRVDLSEVEKSVKKIEGVENAVVLCHRPKEINQTLVAFVKGSTLMEEKQIENILKYKLTSYMVPQVVLVDDIPLLVSGKVDRQSLLKRYENINNVDFDYTGVYPEQMDAAKFLFNTIWSVLERTPRAAISLKMNFFDIGGNSLNSIYVVTELNTESFSISVADFLSANNLGEILERMISSSNSETSPPPFTIEMLKIEHKLEVTDIIATSFSQKGDLEQWLTCDTLESDYKDFFDALCLLLIDKDLSFVVKSPSGKIVGVSLNCDVRDEPSVEFNTITLLIEKFHNSIEDPIKNLHVPFGKNETLYEYTANTHSSLAPKETVTVIQFMEDEVFKLAKKRHFKRILATNLNPLTQQIATDIYHFETLLDYQINQYVASDGTRPFARAPDSQRAMVQWKSI